MNHKNWGVVFFAVAAFTVGFIGGCAPTSPPDDHAVSQEALNICGNAVCDTGETCASCPGDCGRCTQEHCGNDVCGRKETCVTCARDCGACSGCGNGVCEGTETCANCSADCGRCNGEFCGNGVCARRESCTACSRDCCPVITPQCAAPTDCPPTGDAGPIATCLSGQCGTTFAPAGTSLQDQIAGDCLEAQCDGAGAITQVPDDLDLPPDDANECTYQSCSGGSPSYPPEPAGVSCLMNFFCDGAGTCVQCLGDADCPPSANECEVPVCLGGACGTTYAPAGQTTTNQALGDCQVNQCDGTGGTISVADNGDLPNDGNECTTDYCENGVPSQVNVVDGTSCVGPFGTCISGNYILF